MRANQIVVCCGILIFTGSALLSVRSEPVVDPRPAIDPQANMPQDVAAFVTRSCADCHTSHTRWPWYAKLPPGSWMLSHEVSQARRMLDFTEWSSRTSSNPGKVIGALAAACADLQSGRMPRANYLWMHPDARPKPEEVKQFCAWTREEIPRLARLPRHRTQ